MSLLSEILASKRTEVEWSRQRFPLSYLEDHLSDASPTRDFRGALAAHSGHALIAEVKKASPSKGVFRYDFDPLEIAREYAANGATCLSVLTDENYFQGKLEYLPQISRTVDLPLLRKDFIIDEYQILESRAAGADAVLFIVAALPKRDLTHFLKVAAQYDMAAIVEVHDAEEMEEALDAGADLIGINNRNLHTFRTSISTTLDLLAAYPPSPGRLIVSESGIFTHADIEKLMKAGVDAVLVGEALMHAPDIGAKLRELLGETEAEERIPVASAAR